MAENNLDILTCAICLNSYTEPKILNCFHTFCKPCLEGLVNNRLVLAKEFNCPLCRERIRIPEGGVQNFQRNIYIRDDSRLKIDCERCSKEATHLCINCGHPCCEKCRKDHASSGYSKHHRIKKLSELNLPDALKIKQKTFCSIHTAESVKLVCLDCNKTLICYLCASTEHKDHSKTDISSAAAEERLRLSSDLKDCEAFLEKSKIEFRHREESKKAQLLEIENDIRELERKKKAVMSSIESKFKRDVQQIKTRQSTFARKANRSIYTEDRSISNFQSELEKLKKEEELKNDTQFLEQMKLKPLPRKIILKGFPPDSELGQIKENINKWDACLQDMKQLNETMQMNTMRRNTSVRPM